MLLLKIFTFLMWQCLLIKRNKKAIFSLYKVKPTRINILSVPHKNIMSKGKKGTRGRQESGCLFKERR